MFHPFLLQQNKNKIILYGSNKKVLGEADLL